MIEIFSSFNSVFSAPVISAIFVGSVLGIIVGVLPGIGPGVDIAVLLPLTYGMSPLAGISVLLGIYCGAFYGGAITSILIRTPGEASSIMTMFDDKFEDLLKSWFELTYGYPVRQVIDYHEFDINFSANPCKK